MSQHAEAANSLSIVVDRRGDAALLVLRGQVAVADSADLRRELDALVEQKTNRIILDLSECSFICSLGLGAVVSAHIRCRHHCGAICLVKPPVAIMELLTVTRLNRLFRVHRTVQEALEAEEPTQTPDDSAKTH